MECNLKDIKVYYDIRGEGRPMIMIHGFTPDHRLMTGCMEPIFSQRLGWQRIYFDLPGMGNTVGPDWIRNSDQMLDVVLRFINTIILDQNFVIASESYGCYLARGIIHKLAARVDGLLMICPLIITNDAKRTLPTPLALVVDEALLQTLDPDDADEFKSFSTILTEPVWERTAKEVLSGIKAANDEFLMPIRTKGYSFSFDVDAVSTPFEKPTLILLGRQDWMVGYRDAWSIIEKYPRGTFAVLDRASHNLQIEQETLFNSLVNEWLDRLEEVWTQKS